MSTQVRERPTGEQPRLALPADSNPYPGGTRLVRPFAPAPVAVDVPAAAVTVPATPGFTPVTAGPLDVREPGATLTEIVRRAAPMTDLSLLGKARDGLKRIPREGELIFAGTAAEHYGTGPQPASAPEEPPAAPAAVPVPGWPEGVVRGLLIAALWAGARWYGAMDGTGCAGCDADGGLCAWHAERQVKAVGCEKLHDCACAAASDAEALAMVAGVLRSGRIGLGDLAASGSPLEGVLLTVLAADGGAE